MRSRHPLAVPALLASMAFALMSLLAPMRAVAGPEGSYRWLTPMAGYGTFSDQLHYPGNWPLKDAPVFGGRVGMQFHEAWGLELGASFASAKEDRSTDADTKTTVLNGSANLMYTPATWKAGAPYFAIGAGVNQYKADGTDEIHYGTFEQALGWRSWWSSHTALRLEARNVLNVPHRNWGSANKANQQFFAGLDFAWGGKPRDTDGDGVPDKKDKCSNTPTGAQVGLDGCPLDSDGDGVFDGLDQCTGTQKGARVDSKGCPADSDGDGVYDGLDQCADTPKGATVDAKGCPGDADKDGIYDGLDQCANTPSGAIVDGKGCPLDSDGDGVPDGVDKCANTPAGAKVDVDGCPIVVTERETELLDTGMIRLQNVNFETGKSDILPESFGVLDEVGAILRKWPQLKIEVGGHTDSRGSRVKNQTLSENRAAAVKTYLAGRFSDLAADQLSTKGYGSTKPIVPNNTALNMAKNRRVEFVVLNKDVLKKEIEKRRTLQK